MSKKHQNKKEEKPAWGNFLIFLYENWKGDMKIVKVVFKNNMSHFRKSEWNLRKFKRLKKIKFFKEFFVWIKNQILGKINLKLSKV